MNHGSRHTHVHFQPNTIQLDAELLLAARNLRPRPRHHTITASTFATTTTQTNPAPDLTGSRSTTTFSQRFATENTGNIVLPSHGNRNEDDMTPSHTQRGYYDRPPDPDIFLSAQQTNNTPSQPSHYPCSNPDSPSASTKTKTYPEGNPALHLQQARAKILPPSRRQESQSAPAPHSQQLPLGPPQGLEQYQVPVLVASQASRVSPERLQFRELSASAVSGSQQPPDPHIRALPKPLIEISSQPESLKQSATTRPISDMSWYTRSPDPVPQARPPRQQRSQSSHATRQESQPRHRSYYNAEYSWTEEDCRPVSSDEGVIPLPAPRTRSHRHPSGHDQSEDAQHARNSQHRAHPEARRSAAYNSTSRDIYQTQPIPRSLPAPDTIIVQRSQIRPAQGDPGFIAEQANLLYLCNELKKEQDARNVRGAEEAVSERPSRSTRHSASPKVTPVADGPISQARVERPTRPTRPRRHGDRDHTHGREPASRHDREIYNTQLATPAATERSRRVNEFIEALEEDMTCPICIGIMVGPQQVTPCGHTVCGACGVQWIETKATSGETVSCPVCRHSIDPENPLTPARSLETVIKKWVGLKAAADGQWEGMADYKDREECWKIHKEHSPMGSYLPVSLPRSLPQLPVLPRHAQTDRPHQDFFPPSSFSSIPIQNQGHGNMPQVQTVWEVDEHPHSVARHTDDGASLLVAAEREGRTDIGRGRDGNERRTGGYIKVCLVERAFQTCYHGSPSYTSAGRRMPRLASPPAADLIQGLMTGLGDLLVSGSNAPRRSR